MVEQRRIFIRRMAKIGFLNPANAPTEASKVALPTDISIPTAEQCRRMVNFS